MTSSNLVDCRTGKSAGLAPLRRLPHNESGLPPMADMERTFRDFRVGPETTELRCSKDHAGVITARRIIHAKAPRPERPYRATGSRHRATRDTGTYLPRCAPPTSASKPHGRYHPRDRPPRCSGILE